MIIITSKIFKNIDDNNYIKNILKKSVGILRLKLSKRLVGIITSKIFKRIGGNT